MDLRFIPTPTPSPCANAHSSTPQASKPPSITLYQPPLASQYSPPNLAPNPTLPVYRYGNSGKGGNTQLG